MHVCQCVTDYAVAYFNTIIVFITIVLYSVILVGPWWGHICAMRGEGGGSHKAVIGGSCAIPV